MQRSESFPHPSLGPGAELGNNSLTLQNDNEGAAYAKIVVNVEEDTKILDAVTGEEKSFVTSGRMRSSMPGWGRL